MFKGKWNYRIIEHNSEDKGRCCLIHEVYYNEKGEIESWSKHGIGAYGESYDELMDDLCKMVEGALNYKVLVLRDGGLIEKEELLVGSKE